MQDHIAILRLVYLPKGSMLYLHQLFHLWLQDALRLQQIYLHQDLAAIIIIDNHKKNHLDLGHLHISLHHRFLYHPTLAPSNYMIYFVPLVEQTNQQKIRLMIWSMSKEYHPLHLHVW